METLQRVTTEYPHLSLALMEDRLAGVVDHIRQKIAEPAFQLGMMYPLKDANRYDDDYGTGYAFAAVPPDAAHGKAFIHDVWIVNEQGDVHPGYDANPVPMRMDDLVMDACRPNPKDPPRPESIFEGPMFR